jgi:hypothetical protein
MSASYAIDTPDVDTHDELEFTAESDAFDAVGGGLEAYSQAPSTDGRDDELEESFEDKFEDEIDSRAIKLAAVFLLVEIVLLIETVLVVFFAPPDPGDPVGSLLLGLLRVTLFANFVAGIAAGWAAEAGGRCQSNLIATDDWTRYD